MNLTTSRLPMILDEVEVHSVERISPHFVRVELTGPCLGDFGVDDGPLLDQRIKLVLPPDAGVLPSVEGADESWLTSWLDRPVEERGHMRTYTVREVRGSGAETRLVVDIVVHAGGESGPGARWAETARPGDRVVLVGPRRGQPFGGIEFVPGVADRLLLVADETAVPAVSAILAGLPAGAHGTAFCEVPTSADVLAVAAPPGVDVVWLPRDGVDHGERLREAVADHLGTVAGAVELDPELVDPDLWETPSYSSSGEDTVPGSAGTAGPFAGLYAWIAGESGVVGGLRRHLVRELGIDRRQVAFMGYWRRGVAMRS
jgi:NADPH-dependent ferric siderophore reductase